MIVFEDNEAAATIVRTGKFKAMRHVLRHHGVRLGFLHDCVEQGHFDLRNCDASVMGADIFTKFFDNPVSWDSVVRLIGIRKTGKVAFNTAAVNTTVTLEPSIEEPVVLKSALKRVPTSLSSSR